MHTFLVCAEILTHITCINRNEAHAHLVALKNCPVIFQSRQHGQPPLLVIGELSECMVIKGGGN